MKRLLTCVSAIVILCSQTNGQQKVRISGVSQDSTADFVRLNNDFPLWHDFNKPLNNTDLLKDGQRYTLDLPLSKPGLQRIGMIGGTYEIYLTPGDDVRFILTKEGNFRYLQFSGKHAANYNYDVERQRKFKAEGWLPGWRKAEPLDSFKMRLNTWYEREHDFLETYHKQQPLTTDAYRYFSRELDYKYMFALYSPMARGGVLPGQLPAGYLTDVKAKAELQHMLQESTYSVPVFIYKHILYRTDHPYANLDSSYQYILRNFSGRTRQAMVANLIGVFAKNQQDTYYDALLKVVEESPRYVKDSIYVDYVSRSAAEYKYLNKSLPAEVLNNTMLTGYADGRTVSLGQLLETYKGKAVYINFWASWCGACREDHKDAEKADAYLAEKDVVQIFISLDKKKSEPAWRTASVEDKITDKQYLVENDYASPIVKVFGINTIPRHFLLNREHLVKSVNAVRPTTANLMDLKMSVEPILGKVVQFN